VFVKPSGGWTTTGVPNAILTKSGSASDDGLGVSVATSADGSTIVVGAARVNSNKGAAYVFIKPSGGWSTDSTPNAILTNSSGASNDYLGASVAASADGSTIVVGANGVNGHRGAAYVFAKSGSWANYVSPTAVLTKSGGASGDYLGISVAASADGSTIAAGARGVNGSKGAAYVFVKSGIWLTTSAPTAVLTNSGGASGDVLGDSIAMSADGSTITAGAMGVSSNRGAAYVFVKPSISWATDSTPNAVLTNPSVAGNDLLGDSVAMSANGSTIVAGASGVDNGKGAAYVFNAPSALYLPFIKK
jgi:hypothetical protein